MTYKFYYPNGEEVNSRDDFIDYYSRSYYFDTNKNTEDDVLRILKEGIREAEDVFEILAWKLGKTKRFYSENEEKYYKGWNKDKLEGETYGIKIDCNDIYDHIQEWKEKKDKSLECFLNSFKMEKEKKIKGLGNVYLVTLWYFAKKGEDAYIYDKYAYKALKAIEKTMIEEKFEVGSGLSVSDISSMSIDKACEQYKEYADLVNKIFGEIKDKIGYRKIDQALWKYGHLFPDK